MSIKKVQENEQKKTAPILKAFMNENGLSFEGFAKLWGGSKGTAHALINGECEPSYKILRSLRRTGMSIDNLIDTAEQINVVSEQKPQYKPAAKYPSDLQHIIDEWPKLCDAQKSAVIGVLDAFSKQEVFSLEKNGTQG